MQEEQTLSAEDLALIAPLEDVKPVINGHDPGAPADVTWMRNSSLFTRKAAAGHKSQANIVAR